MANIIQKPGWHLPDSSATPEPVYRNRREFLAAIGLGGMAAAGLAIGGPVAHAETAAPKVNPMTAKPLPAFEKNPAFADAGRELTREELATSFNNFYEFSYGKEGAKSAAADFVLDPYTLRIDGLVEKPITLDLDAIEALGLEERVYRFRCVEAWGMTIPWLGVPLAAVLKKAVLKPEAKFVAFTSFLDPEQAPNQKDTQFKWPYYEGLRLDEAMNDLTLVTVGMYGKRLPPQNGAPLRVVVPWKYGYKGPKSVVRMTLTDTQPATFWNDAIPNEYGFESNVNPEKPHPRWTQATEWRLNTGRTKRYETLKFNGYAAEVAALYA